MLAQCHCCITVVMSSNADDTLIYHIVGFVLVVCVLLGIIVALAVRLVKLQHKIDKCEYISYHCLTLNFIISSNSRRLWCKQALLILALLSRLNAIRIALRWSTLTGSNLLL